VLVDDDRYFIKLTELLVTRARPDFELVEFCDAVSALDFLSHQSADLIVTDVRMPVMNGLQFTRSVRAIHPGVPIVVISSEDLECDALAHGASAFVSKRVVNPRLRAVIEKLCAPGAARGRDAGAAEA
jgi:CheY-like chemotaxis protein